MWGWVKQYWIEALFGAIIGGLSTSMKFLWGRQRKQAKKQAAVEDGLRGLLHNELYKDCLECERKKYADTEDRANLEALYAPYHALGGNGTGTDLYNRVRALPIEPPED